MNISEQNMCENNKCKDEEKYFLDAISDLMDEIELDIRNNKEISKRDMGLYFITNVKKLMREKVHSDKKYSYILDSCLNMFVENIFEAKCMIAANAESFSKYLNGLFDFIIDKLCIRSVENIEENIDEANNLIHEWMKKQSEYYFELEKHFFSVRLLDDIKMSDLFKKRVIELSKKGK